MEKQNIDLSTFTRDNLRSLLSKAKDEWKKYNNCKEKIERCEMRIEENKKKLNEKIGVGCGIAMSCGFVLFGILVVAVTPKDNRIDLLGVLIPIGLFGIGVIYGTVLKIKTDKEARGNIEKEEVQLPNLQKNVKKALSEFDKVYEIPEDFCYEYALTKMLRYIDNYEAHSWKEVTARYRTHIHEKTVEDNTRITASEAREQTELARQTLNAARWLK